MDPDKLKSQLSADARRLIAEMTNRAIAAGPLTDLYRELLAQPRPPYWLRNLSTSRTDMEKVRREGGRILGSDARKVADWDTVTRIAQLRVPDEEREEVLARWAGWWCRAQNLLRPPGYDGPISFDEEYVPRLQDPTQATDVETCVRLFQQQIATTRSETEDKADRLQQEAGAAREQATRREVALAAAEQQLEVLRKVRDRTTRELAAKDSAIAQLRGNVEGLERSRLQVERVHETRVRMLQEDYSRTAAELRHAEQAVLDKTQLVALLVAEVVSTNTAGTVKVAHHVAMLAAPGLRGVFATPSAGTHVPESARRFAAYVQAHLIMLPEEQNVFAQAAAHGIFDNTMGNILSGTLLPDTQQWEALVAICPQIGVHGTTLLEQARADDLINSIHDDMATARQRTVAELLAAHGSSLDTTRPRRQRARSSDDPAAAPDSVAIPAPRSAETIPKRRPVSPRMRKRVIRVGIIALMLMTLWGVTIHASEAIKLANTEPTLRFHRGARPVAGFGDNGAPTQTWQHVKTGDATVYRVDQDGFVPTGLTGTLRVHPPVGCSPAIGVIIRPFGERAHTLSLHRDTPTADLTKLSLTSRFNQIEISFIRVDLAPCLVAVVWESPGVR